MKNLFLVVGFSAIAMAVYFAFQNPRLSGHHPLAPNALAGSAWCGFAILAGLRFVVVAIISHGDDRTVLRLPPNNTMHAEPPTARVLNGTITPAAR